MRLQQFIPYSIISSVKSLMGRIDSRRTAHEQLSKFNASGIEERASYWESKFDAKELAVRAAKAGIHVREVKVDLIDFDRWMADFPDLTAFYSQMGNVFIEKVLEHYLTVKYLEVQETDVLMDVAAASSPFAESLRKRGIDAWRQDLSYAPGIKGIEIGGDAANMPLLDGFANVLTLHCAFECFQGDADIRFFGEASRVLRDGGRLGIAPLYMDTIHFVKVSPYCDKRKICIEEGAMVLWRDDEYREPFSRHYSPEIFAERISRQTPMLEGEILYFSNLDKLSKRYEGQRIYCHFMYRGIRKGVLKKPEQKESVDDEAGSRKDSI